MAHSLILGMTESGKTTLAKQLSHHYKHSGHGVIVLDPLCDPGWSADFTTPDPDEFLRVLWNSRSCFVFIDEAGEAVGRYDDAMNATAKRGRHWGHSMHYVTQRGAELSKTVRDQCSRLFLFSMSLDDCKLFAREFNKPQLIDAAQFKAGEYYYCGRFIDAQKGQLF